MSSLGNMSLLFILFFGIGIDKKMSVSGQLSSLEKACYDLPEVKVTFTCSSSLCHEKDFSRPCVPGCEGKILPIVSYICRVKENQHNSTTPIWHSTNYTSDSPSDPYCLPWLEIVPARTHNTSMCKGINAHLENLRLLAVKSGEQNGTCNFLIIELSQVEPEAGSNRYVNMKSDHCAEIVVEIYSRDFKLSPDYHEVTPPILSSEADPRDHHLDVVAGSLGFLAVAIIIIVILFIYNRKRHVYALEPQLYNQENPSYAAEMLESKAAEVEEVVHAARVKFKKTGPKRACSDPNITIVNNSSYPIIVRDTFFHNNFLLASGKIEKLGSNAIAAETEVTILAYDGNNMAIIKFTSWTGFSWIVKDKKIKQQKWDSANPNQEDPKGISFPWTKLSAI